MADAADILFEERPPLAVVTLNRPKALNALTLEMCLALETKLEAYAGDDAIRAVIVKGAGDRAFCAGGDIRKLYDEGRAGGDYPRQFYANEYRLNALIHHYAKPFIAFMDGIVMGGGVGVSVHGSHRVVSERVMFAMPETGIGLFPDVGGSYFLSRAPGHIGLYMAMTGYRLKAADALYAGVGDVHIPSDQWQDVEAALAAADWSEATADTVVTDILQQFHTDPGTPPLASDRGQVDRLLEPAATSGRLEKTIAALEADGTEFAEKMRATMAEKSPTSLKLALRQILQGADKDFRSCMQMEYRLAVGCIAGHDFYEGVRAVVIDKDQAPKWQPAQLSDVTDAVIDSYFDTVPATGDLSFDRTASA